MKRIDRADNEAAGVAAKRPSPPRKRKKLHWTQIAKQKKADQKETSEAQKSPLRRGKADDDITSPTPSPLPKRRVTNVNATMQTSRSTRKKKKADEPPPFTPPRSTRKKKKVDGYSASPSKNPNYV